MNKLKCILLLSGLLGVMPAQAAFVQQVEVSTATSTSPQNLPAMTVTAGDCLVLFAVGPKPYDTVTIGGGTFTRAVGAGSTTPYTFSAPPTGSSATLTANWTETTGYYAMAFSDQETRLGYLQNGSAAVSWGAALTGTPTTTINIGDNDGVVAYYEANAAGGSTSVTVSASGNLYGAALVEYSGCATTSTLLGASAGFIAAPHTGTDAILTDVLSTASTPSDVIGFTWTPGQTTASTDITAGTGYTGRTAVFGTLGKYGFLEDQQPSSGTSFKATWTSDSSAQYDGFASVVLALKASAAGPCTHAGWLQSGTFTVPNGTSGSYWGKTGAWVTPDCSTVQYWQQQRVFGVN